MNANALKGFIIKKGLNVEKLLALLSDLGVNMSKNTFYRNINGEQEFTIAIQNNTAFS